MPIDSICICCNAQLQPDLPHVPISSPPQANLEPLQLAHLWALLLEAGCPPAAPPPQMAGYLARPEMQATCG